MSTSTDDPDGRPPWEDLHDGIDLERTRAQVLGRLFGGSRAPVKIGRFVISSTAGEGEMGRVYVARDPELDREVAIKIIRAGSLGAERAAARRARLRREAQALASLQHPNVIAVHEVGRYDDDVFIVMEYIRGPSLRSWLAHPRSWKEVLPVFVGAGQGLAAAHREGLVHRDFKPDNVLVAPDGRAVVLDFGLVQSAASEPNETTADASALAPDSRLTRTGGIVGTPAYMSPEQMRGLAADPRSDQFSFCVALFEALSSERPFAGATTAALLESIRSGQTPALRGAPRRIHRALARGLSFDPAQRFETMAGLLEELDQRPGSRRLLVAGAAVVIGLSAVAVWATPSSLGPPTPDCGAGAQRVAEVWNDDKAQALRESFAAADLVYADALATKVIGVFDQRSDDWSTMHREACEATHVRNEQSERLLDLRMACLNRALADHRAVARMLVDPDPNSIERASTIVSRLPDLAECADVEALVSQTPLPTDPKLRAAIEQATQRLSEARGLDAAARYDEAQTIIDELRVDPAVEAYGPLRARTLFVRARLLRALGEDGIERAFLDAVSVAEGHRQDGAAIKCWRSLAEDTRGSPEAELRSDGYLERLEAAVTRQGAGPEERARLEGTRGRIALRKGKYEVAVTHLERAVEMLPTIDEPFFDGAVRMDLAAVWFKLGKYERAAEEFARVEAIFAELHGPEHPYTARAMGNRGQCLLVLGKNREAIEVLTRSLGIEVAAVGPDHPKVALADNSLASAHYQLGEFERAHTLYADAIRIYEMTLGSDDPKLGPPLANLGRVLTQLDRHDEAVAAASRAVQLTEVGKGAEHPELVTLLTGLGHVYARAEKLEEAAEAHRRAIELGSKTLGADHVRVAYSQRSLADVELRRGRVEAALEAAQDAETRISSSLGARHPQRASALLTLGRVEGRAGRVSDARTHLQLAVEIYLEVEAPPDELGEARRELAGLRAP